MSVIFVYLLSYANLGCLVFFVLEVKDYFKQYLKVEPSQLQQTTALMFIPWSVKLIYGMLSDCAPIYGYRRKSYLIINGVIAFASLMAIVPEYFDTYSSVTVFLVLHMVGVASTDILADSLMVVESKKDKERGSEDLQTLSFISNSLFGVLGAILGALFT